MAVAAFHVAILKDVFGILAPTIRGEPSRLDEDTDYFIVPEAVCYGGSAYDSYRNAHPPRGRIGSTPRRSNTSSLVRGVFMSRCGSETRPWLSKQASFPPDVKPWSSALGLRLR